MTMLPSLLHYLLISVILWPLSEVYSGSSVLDTSYGQMTGKIVDLNIGSLPLVSQYLSVPYGMAPEGNRRYMPPQNAAKWLRHSKDATRLPPVCIQNFPDISDPKKALNEMTLERLEFLKRLKEFLRDQREDCLYMNLYVPVLNKKSGSSADKLPIIVFIHGESFEWNSGNPYDGSVLASYGEVVFITLNYRLGALGFLSSGDPIISGNRALHDILAALNMIHVLAPDFGGDTSRITLLGVGTGAALVNLLMSAPPALPADIQLFHRAIVLGGSALSKWSIVENPREYLYLFAEKAGCQTTAPTKFGIEFLPPSAVLPCLQQLPVANITRAERNMPHPTYLSIFAPVLDGIFVVREPQENLRFHGDLYHRYDVLFGLNKNEAYNGLSESSIADGIDVDRRSKIYRTLVRNLFNFHRTEIYEAIVNEYTDWSNPSTNPAEIRDDVLNALSDGLFVAPLIQAAKLHAQNEASPTPSSRTYFYVFAHQSKENVLKGSISNEDLSYLLGYPLIRQGQLNIPYNVSHYTTRDKIVSEMLMRYLTNFAKSGDPNSPVDPGDFVADIGNTKLQDKVKALKWPSFDVPTGKEQFLTISDKPRIGHFYRAHQVAFWSQFLPKLHRQLEGHTDLEHHFLPHHRDRSSFFGEVFPLGGYFSAPFTPPPVPPPAIPDEVLTTLATKKKAAEEAHHVSAAADAPGPTAQPIETANYSTILSVTVAVGCGLLILNIIVFAAIYHQKDKKRRRKKQTAMHYQSYNSTGTYLNSPITHVGAGHPAAPAPPPLSVIPSAHSNSFDHGNSVLTLSTAMQTSQFAQNPAATMPRSGSYPEQEPLLARRGSAGANTGLVCSRHARSPARSVLEEVQV